MELTALISGMTALISGMTALISGMTALISGMAVCMVCISGLANQTGLPTQWSVQCTNPPWQTPIGGLGITNNCCNVLSWETDL